MPGAAHFAEHLAFARRNKERFAQLTALGTHVDGATSYDYTQFSATGRTGDLDLALEFVADIVRNPELTADEIEGEKSVFYHELAGDDDESPRTASLNAFWRRTLGAPNWRNGQTKTSVRIKCFTADRLNTFKQHFYHPTNARLAIVSPLSCEELHARCLARLPSAAPHAPTTAAKPVRNWSNRRSLTVSWDIHGYIWAEVMYAMPTTSPALRFAADIIAYVLGGGPHSRLFKHLRTERGVAYETSAEDWAFFDSTAMHAFFCVPKRALHDSMTFLLEQLDEFASGRFTAEEFDAQKTRMLRWHEMAMDHPHSLAAYLAYEALRPASVVVSPDGYSSALQELKLAEFNQASEKLIAPKNRFTFLGGRIGPISRWRIKRSFGRAILPHQT